MAHGPTFWLPNIVQPIGTVLIGIAGSFIARRQWLTANEKFRFDLFEKRYEIYQSVDASLSSLIQQGDENIRMGDIESLELRITDVYLFYGSSIGNSVQSAATAARRLLGIKSGGIKYRMQESTLDLQTKLFGQILMADTSTLMLMKVYIDFSKSGRPTDIRSLWHFNKVVRGAFRLFRLT